MKGTKKLMERGDRGLGFNNSAKPEPVTHNLPRRTFFEFKEKKGGNQNKVGEKRTKKEKGPPAAKSSRGNQVFLFKNCVGRSKG